MLTYDHPPKHSKAKYDPAAVYLQPCPTTPVNLTYYFPVLYIVGAVIRSTGATVHTALYNCAAMPVQLHLYPCATVRMLLYNCTCPLVQLHKGYCATVHTPLYNSTQGTTQLYARPRTTVQVWQCNCTKVIVHLHTQHCISEQAIHLNTKN